MPSTGPIIVWSLQAEKVATIIQSGHKYHSLSFSEDSKYLFASGFSFDMDIKMELDGNLKLDSLTNIKSTLTVWNSETSKSQLNETNKIIFHTLAWAEENQKIVVLSTSPVIQNSMVQEILQMYELQKDATLKMDHPAGKTEMGWVDFPTPPSAISPDGSLLVLDLDKQLVLFKLDLQN